MSLSRKRRASTALAAVLTAAAAAATAAAGGTPVPANASTAPLGASHESSGATLSGPLDPLGVNTAAWDTNFTDAAIPGDLSAAHLGLIRYPGGSTADVYDWQANTVSGAAQSVDFAQYARQVDAVSGGQKLVTVNYGTGTPQEAAAWVRQSLTPGDGVALWEVGNEEYGSWEADNHADPHTAASYAANALPFLQDMKAVSPRAQTCYDYAMDGSLAPGSGVTGWQAWNDTILQADAADINCADVHWYPINGLPAESVESIMQLVGNIPAAAAEVHAALSAYDPRAYFIVGETNMSQTANPWNEEPVGALFAAANALEWLSYGAQSVDWWDVHNYGSPTADFGMFSSATSGEPALDTPFPPYYGYELAAKLAVNGARVATLALSAPNVYGYESRLPDGSRAVLLVNADPSASATVPAASLGITGSRQAEYTYDSAHPAIVSGSFSGRSVSVPAESIVVLTNATAARSR